MLRMAMMVLVVIILVSLRYLCIIILTKEKKTKHINIITEILLYGWTR